MIRSIYSPASILIAVLTIALLAYPFHTASTGTEGEVIYDILIKGGTVIDGTGADGKIADVLIKDNEIKYVGDVDINEIQVDRTIDATGKVVTPGFIDAHSHGDPLQTPEFENFISMGVTTITLGQDGSSPMVEDISEWMNEVNRVQPAVNIAMFVGHGTVRRLAGVGFAVDVTDDDIRRMVRLIEDAMEAGCFGLSSGLEYQPGSFAEMNELIAVARPVGKLGGMVMSHMRSEDDDKIEEALDELITQGMKADCPVHVSHLKITYGNEVSRAEDILSQMQAARDAGLRITADVYPYTASYTGIAIVFPNWAKAPHDYDEVVQTRRDELAEYLRNRVELRNGPEATLFGTEPWAGKTLAEVADELGKPFEDVLIEMGPGGANAAYFVMNEGLMERFLIDPYVMISSDGSLTMRHPRGYGSFAKIIRKYVNERELFSLEEAVHKMTGLTAETIGLTQLQLSRGHIKAGFAADVLIFDPDNVLDNATFEQPHKLSEGFDYVIVNGRFAIEDGKITGYRSGRVLRLKFDV